RGSSSAATGRATQAAAAARTRARRTRARRIRHPHEGNERIIGFLDSGGRADAVPRLQHEAADGVATTTDAAMIAAKSAEIADAHARIAPSLFPPAIRAS
ncbi:MAG TPA: hypothetical protein PKC95_10470, partial [Thauera aminoaromatica]|nr:hypothetical protein [Thauera aminoaromatica]